MARLFDDAQSEYLTHAAAVKNVVPFAMVTWFKSNSLTVNQTLMSITDASNDSNFFDLSLRGAAAGDKLMAAVLSSGSWRYAVTSSGYSANNWHHACGLFVSATDRRVLIDGTDKGTNSDSFTPVAGNLDTTSLGVIKRPSIVNYMSGRIAEAAIYDLSVWPGATASDKGDNFERILPSLVKGVSPKMYPLGLAAYWSLVRGLNDKVGGYNLTASGTVVAAHPSVILPCGAL